MLRYCKPIIFITLFLATICVFHCKAQDSLEVKPHFAAVLVQLKAEQARAKAMQENHQSGMLAILETEKNKIMQAMLADFTDNFNYCPVFYFIDTNYEAVRAKKFNGVLLNKDLSPASNLPLSSSDTNYIVVAYGKPARQTRYEHVVEDSIAQDRATTGVPGDGLIICDDKLRQISYLYKLEFDELFMRRRFDKKYYYKSKEFKMEYFPFAGLLNEKLHDNPNHIPITRIWGK